MEGECDVLPWMINKANYIYFWISCLAWWCQWCVCLYTHQFVACAYYMYAFVSSPDHSLWPGELPGEASWVYLSLPEHHGVWCWQHPLPEGGVWRVSQTNRKRYWCYFAKIVCFKCPYGPACCLNVSVYPSACCWQLGRIWALQLLWTAVCVGERRVSSLGVMERQQRLPHWEDDVFPPHLLCCESLSQSNIFCFPLQS